MADDIADLVLVFLQEFAGGRKGDLIDILVDFLLRHTDTVIDDFQGFGLFVQLDPDLQVTDFVLAVARGGERLHLLGRIHCIRHQLAQENLMVTVQELLDNGKNVFGSHTDLSFVCHIFFYILDFSTSLENKRKPAPHGGTGHENVK